MVRDSERKITILVNSLEHMKLPKLEVELSRLRRLIDEENARTAFNAQLILGQQQSTTEEEMQLWQLFA